LKLTLSLPLPGLYYKLHGTHRPNSMKKTVIKRRKRVPAAPGGSPSAQDRMTDQAAAAILASVGRPHGSQTGAEESAEEAEGQPRRKRARKSKAEKEKEAMVVDEEGDPSAVSRSGTAGRGRKGTSRGARKRIQKESDVPSLGWPEDSVQSEAGPSGQEGELQAY
jgi:GATA-binding protein, other eukaryote